MTRMQQQHFVSKSNLKEVLHHRCWLIRKNYPPLLRIQQLADGNFPPLPQQPSQMILKKFSYLNKCCLCSLDHCGFVAKSSPIKLEWYLINYSRNTQGLRQPQGNPNVYQLHPVTVTLSNRIIWTQDCYIHTYQSKKKDQTISITSSLPGMVTIHLAFVTVEKTHG